MSGTATIQGDKQVIKLLRDLKGKVKDMAPVWVQIGDIVSDEMTQAFDSQGVSANGVPWAPLSPPYLRWKLRHGFDPRVLHQTGAMRNSFTSRPMSIEKYARHQATFGSDDPKAAFHQFGTSKMPQRRILNVTPEFSARVNDRLRNYLTSQL